MLLRMLRVVVTLLMCVMLIGSLSTVTSAATFTTRGPKPMFYLSLGDSLAVGIQPGFADNSETLHGYSNRVVNDVGPKYKLILRNFGCGGETTAQMLASLGCPSGSVAANGVSYPASSQLSAALTFVRAHRAQIGLITVNIGGNDIDQHVALGTMKSNLMRIGALLRSAAGTKVPILGLNSYDTVLASWLSGVDGQTLAEQSVVQYRSSINPTFAVAFAHSRVTLVDVSTAFGTFIPLSRVANYASYGSIPIAVKNICTLTWNCQLVNEHPTNAGYALIASLIAKTYRKLAA